jgi:hypothetical protein
MIVSSRPLMESRATVGEDSSKDHWATGAADSALNVTVQANPKQMHRSNRCEGTFAD